MKLCFLAFCVLYMLGCGAREEIIISKLDLIQNQWDSLQVQVAFSKSTVLSKSKPVRADSIHIIAYNASYDTLYAGTDTLFHIPDPNLGNRERILLEVCGQVKLIRVCEQTSAQASPKRIRLMPEIAYPWRDRLYQGSYRLPFSVERKPFMSDVETWEPVNRTRSIDGFILAYVNGKQSESVRFPFSSKQGSFNLTHHTNYKDFKYYLDSALLDNNQANVRFDVYVNVDGFPETVGSISKEIALKSDEEHQVEVARLSKLAAEQLVDRLHPYLSDRRSVVFIDSWDYSTFKKMYTVELEIEWTGRSFTRNQYRVKGILEVNERGIRSTFRLLDANRRARRLWDLQTEGSTMALESFDSFQAGTPTSEPTRRNLFTFRDDILLIESENFHETSSSNGLSWSLERDRRRYEGSGAMVVLPDRGVRIRERYRTESPSLAYNIAFPEKGTYYIWMRLWARDNNSNSLHAGLNGREISTAKEIETDEYREWNWTRSKMGDRGYARIAVPSAGVHTLNVWMREDGLYLDRILLTRKRSYRPIEARLDGD